MVSTALDKLNSEFWEEFCGTNDAVKLGITDSSKKSLQLFDAWYMEFYSYLDKYIPFKKFSGKKVLEIGLGYGTVSAKIHGKSC